MSAAVLVLSCGMTAFAAEANLNTDTEQKDIGVYVKYVDNTVWNTVPTDEDGDGSATLPDGTEVGISDADKTKGQLVIDPITDKEALDWINSVTDGKVKAPQAFHIYYLDDTGNMINADGIPESRSHGKRAAGEDGRRLSPGRPAQSLACQHLPERVRPRDGKAGRACHSVCG